MKIGDIVKAKFGAVVFTSETGSFNIKPYGIITEIKKDDVMVKIVFTDEPEVSYKGEDLDIISSTNLVKP